MPAFVTVHQLLSSPHEKAFLNVESPFGGIGVWGSTYMKPTILLKSAEDKDSLYFMLMQFENEGYMAEWLESNKKLYTVVANVENLISDKED